MKKTKISSRRKRTLRRVLVAAAAVLLANRIFLVGLLFPIQAVRQYEERQGTGRTAVVRRDWAPEIYKSQLVYLTENENVTMLSGARLTLYGWMENFGVPLDCTEEAPIHGGWWVMNRHARDANLFYVFGRIDDPEIAYLKVQVENREDPPKEINVWWFAGFEWGIKQEDWIVQDGRSYFLVKKFPVNWDDYPYYRVVAVGYDDAGNEIARVELDQGGGSSFS